MVIKKKHLYLHPNIDLRPRPGGYPEQVMTFKNDENLQFLKMAAIAVNGKETDAEKHGRELYDGLVDAGLMEDTMANVGVTIQKVLGNQHVKDVCNFLYSIYGIPIPSGLFDTFCKLEIVSEGCPECGGKLEFCETEGHELNDGDYWTPNTYIVDEYIYRCAECGETIKSEKEL